MYRARLLDLDFFPGSESLEVALYKEDEIPWPQLAFRTILHTLEFFFADRKTGHFPVHTRDVYPDQRPQQTSAN